MLFVVFLFWKTLRGFYENCLDLIGNNVMTVISTLLFVYDVFGVCFFVSRVSCDFFHLQLKHNIIAIKAKLNNHHVLLL